MGERIVYQRISTKSQNLARQEATATNHNVDKIFVDVMSGKDTKRPQLQEMLTYARAGDVLIIESLSRFEREIMLERVAEGVAAAKAAGKFTGGKPKPTDWDKFEKRKYAICPSIS